MDNLRESTAKETCQLEVHYPLVAAKTNGIPPQYPTQVYLIRDENCIFRKGTVDPKYNYDGRLISYKTRATKSLETPGEHILETLEN